MCVSEATDVYVGELLSNIYLTEAKEGFYEREGLHCALTFS